MAILEDGQSTLTRKLLTIKSRVKWLMKVVN